MNSDIALIKTAAIEINGLAPHDTVKIAGVLRKLKNWFKSFLSPEYKQNLEDLKQKSSIIQPLLDNFNNHLTILQNTIDDVDVQGYKQALINVQRSSIELSKELTKLYNSANNANLKLDVVSPKTLDKSLLSPHLNELHGRKNLNISVQKANIGLTESNVEISENTKNLIRTNIGFEIDNEFFRVLSGRVAHGMLTRYVAPKPTDRQRNLNEMIVVVRVSFVYNDLDVELDVILTDMVNSQNPKGIFKIKNIANVDVKKYKDQADVDEEREEQRKEEKQSRYDLDLGADRKDELIKTAAEVPLKKTILKNEQLAEALRAGFRQVFGREPTMEELGTGWAQAMIEQGGNYNNYNFGNVTAGKKAKDAGLDYFKVSGVTEYDKFGTPRVQDMYFRSYANATEGAVSYWNVIKKNPAFKWFGTGDALSSGLVLGKSGYYTGNRVKYSESMQSLYDKFIANIAPKISGIQSAPATDPGPKPEKEAFDKPAPGSELVLPPYGPQPTPKQDQGFFESVINGLSAFFKSVFAQDDGPVTSLVKNATMPVLVPTTTALISLSGEFADQVRFAHILNFAMRNYLKADSAILTNNKTVEIEFDVAGNSNLVKQAVTELAGVMSEAFEKGTGRQVKCSVFLDSSRFEDILDSKTTEKAFRKFAIGQTCRSI